MDTPPNGDRRGKIREEIECLRKEFAFFDSVVGGEATAKLLFDNVAERTADESIACEAAAGAIECTGDRLRNQLKFRLFEAALKHNEIFVEDLARNFIHKEIRNIDIDPRGVENLAIYKAYKNFKSRPAGKKYNLKALMKRAVRSVAIDMTREADANFLTGDQRMPVLTDFPDLPEVRPWQIKVGMADKVARECLAFGNARGEWNDLNSQLRLGTKVVGLHMFDEIERITHYYLDYCWRKDVEARDERDAIADAQSHVTALALATVRLLPFAATEGHCDRWRTDLSTRGQVTACHDQVAKRVYEHLRNALRDQLRGLKGTALAARELFLELISGVRMDVITARTGKTQSALRQNTLWRYADDVADRARTSGGLVFILNQAVTSFH